MKESYKACFRKAVKLHTYENTSKLVFLENHLKNIFGIYLFIYFFFHFETSLLWYSKSIFRKGKPLRLMPISMFLKANVQRLGSYKKTLKAKLSKCPQWSHWSVDASQLLDHSLRWRSHTSVEGCRTSGVWLEYESILSKLLRVSEVATNHWVFLRCNWSPDSIWLYYRS